MINHDYTKTVFRNNIKRYNTNPRLAGSCDDELDCVLELLIEIVNEALVKSDKDYFLQDVVFKIRSA